MTSINMCCQGLLSMLREINALSIHNILILIYFSELRDRCVFLAPRVTETGGHSVTEYISTMDIEQLICGLVDYLLCKYSLAAIEESRICLLGFFQSGLNYRRIASIFLYTPYREPEASKRFAIQSLYGLFKVCMRAGSVPPQIWDARAKRPVFTNRRLKSENLPLRIETGYFCVLAF